MPHIKRPFLLCILDGFGLADAGKGNAVTTAQSPYIDSLFSTYPHGKIYTHGAYVGLPDGQMGNSEVGHMTIGSGRIILQSLDRIRKAFETEEIKTTRAWHRLEKSVEKSRYVHVFALLSDGGVHSHTDHVIALCRQLASQGKPVLVHGITDGRDTSPFCADTQVSTFLKALKDLKNVHLATLGGRFYSMDRDNRWERMEEACTTYTSPEPIEKTWEDCVKEAHASETTDEFIKPVAFSVETLPSTAISAEDTLVFANFRADRMRQLVRSFVEDIDELNVSQVFPENIFTMTEYDKNFNNKVHVLFPPEEPENTLGEIVAKAGEKQLRIAESEKYAHVTFFLNGGRETPFKGEDRIVIPSPKVKTYDLAPAMSLPEVTDALIASLNSENYDLIVLNIANGDQVGHSGNFQACVEAVGHIDKALKRILPVIQAQGGEAVIIADHGNCEEMLDKDGKVMTSHSTKPVPILYVGREADVVDGGLADVAPTVLSLMGHTIPEEMSGRPLVTIKS